MEPSPIVVGVAAVPGGPGAHAGPARQQRAVSPPTGPGGSPLSLPAEHRDPMGAIVPETLGGVG